MVVGHALTVGSVQQISLNSDMARGVKQFYILVPSCLKLGTPYMNRQSLAGMHAATA